MAEPPAAELTAAPRSPGAAAARAAEDQPLGGVDVWERWLPAWNLYVFAVLGVTTALALLGPDLSGPSLALVLALVALQVAAHWWTWIRQPVWLTPSRQRAAYVVFLLASFAVLVRLSPTFAFLQFSLFPQIFFSLRRRQAVAASLSIAAILAADKLLDSGGNVQAALPEITATTVSVVAFTMISAWIGEIIAQSAERRTLLEELAQARAELAAAERQAGMLEERARLSREIHDTLAQGFASVVTHLEAADAALATDPERARRHVNTAEAVARASLDEARALVWELRPPALADGGLPAALERAAAAADGASIEITVTGVPRPLHPDVDVTLLRAAQEALANVRRHAGTCRATVTLTYFDDEVSLDVVDDGSGFDPSSVGAPGPSGGHGLPGMRQRAERLGGRLEVESAPGEGTTVALSLPAPALPGGIS